MHEMQRDQDGSVRCCAAFKVPGIEVPDSRPNVTQKVCCCAPRRHGGLGTRATAAWCRPGASCASMNHHGVKP